MNHPTQKELLDHLDGVLDPRRAAEIDLLLSSSPDVRREYELHRALRRTVRSSVESPSPQLADAVLDRVLPQESMAPWMRWVERYSGVLAPVAMAAVLATVFLISPASAPVGGSIFSREKEQFFSAAEKILNHSAVWESWTSGPSKTIYSSSGGNLFLMGFAAFVLLLAADHLFRHRFTSMRMK